MQGTATTPAAPEHTPAERLAQAKYEYHRGVLRILRQASTDETYHAALLDIYRQDGRDDMIPLVEAAIAEMLEHAADAGELVSA